MRTHTSLCEDAIGRGAGEKVAEEASAVARLANRVIQVAAAEAENSEDPMFVRNVNAAVSQLQRG